MSKLLYSVIHPLFSSLSFINKKEVSVCMAQRRQTKRKRERVKRERETESNSKSTFAKYHTPSKQEQHTTYR